MRISDWSSDVCSSDLAVSEAGLGEIVVTATRRATNLQDTPVAVSAIDQGLIEQASPRDIGDLAAFVPNFSAATVTNFNAASFAIRGVGQNSIIVYFEPPVAVLVDDFVVSSVQTQLLDTFRSEEHTSELQSLMRISYAVFCLKKKKTN